MLGLLSYDEGRTVELERTQLLGMPVLQVHASSGGRWAKYRLGRAARLLTRRGVRRVLVPRSFGCWALLERRGLAGVNPLPLYRAMADRLVLAMLERIGVDPQCACVALRGESVDADLVRTAHMLCPRVRSVTVEAARGGERLMQELYWEFGAVAASQTADAAVRFGGAAQEGELVLCGRVPNLLGLGLEVPELELPGEMQPLPLLTALWQAGRLGLEEIHVRDETLEVFASPNKIP